MPRGTEEVRDKPEFEGAIRLGFDDQRKLVAEDLPPHVGLQLGEGAELPKEPRLHRALDLPLRQFR